MPIGQLVCEKTDLIRDFKHLAAMLYSTKVHKLLASLTTHTARLVIASDRDTSPLPSLGSLQGFS